MREIAYQEQQAMMAAIEKGEDGKSYVGAVRMVEKILRILFTEPDEAPDRQTEDPFTDPADVFRTQEAS